LKAKIQRRWSPLKINIKTAVVLTIALSLGACDFQKEMDAKFGDQHFKTTISLIELHRIRYNSYPETLKDLKFLGEWDQVALSAVEYRRVDGGYELNVKRGWVGSPELSYPNDFWKGLGLVSSNATGKR